MSEHKPICTITKAEIEHMLKLHKNAQETPMIKFTSDPTEKDMSAKAWDAVREFQQEMGKKYGYQWDHVVINPEGEVFPQ